MQRHVFGVRRLLHSSAGVSGPLDALAPLVTGPCLTLAQEDLSRAGAGPQKAPWHRFPDAPWPSYFLLFSSPQRK